MQYGHGGDIYTYKARFHTQTVLDYSANINPWGLTDEVRSAMHNAVEQCTRYPDPFSRDLTNALAERHQLDRSMFFCANGAAEIFFRLAEVIRPERALITAPTFSEYETALSHCGCDVQYYMLDNACDFMVSDDIMAALGDVDLCILCNPNNPTGRTVDPKRMREILEYCQSHDIWLVVDECFADFLVNEATHSLIPLIEKFDKLVIVRAFTKMFAVPGVRLGWCASSNKELVEKLYQAGQPWNVSVIAQACGQAALSIQGYAESIAQQIKLLREKLYTDLKACGLRVFASEVNYLLFFTDQFDLAEKLLPRGIMIRDCANFKGLSKGYFRVAVRTQDENDKLVYHIREVLNG